MQVDRTKEREAIKWKIYNTFYFGIILRAVIFLYTIYFIFYPTLLPNPSIPVICKAKDFSGEDVFLGQVYHLKLYLEMQCKNQALGVDVTKNRDIALFTTRVDMEDYVNRNYLENEEGKLWYYNQEMDQIFFNPGRSPRQGPFHSWLATIIIILHPILCQYLDYKIDNWAKEWSRVGKYGEKLSSTIDFEYYSVETFGFNFVALFIYIGLSLIIR